MEKKYYKYNIAEMDALLTPYFYKETELKKTTDDKEYMQKVGFFANLKQFAGLNRKLMYRMLFKRRLLR